MDTFKGSRGEREKFNSMAIIQTRDDDGLAQTGNNRGDKNSLAITLR